MTATITETTTEERRQGETPSDALRLYLGRHKRIAKMKNREEYSETSRDIENLIEYVKDYDEETYVIMKRHYIAHETVETISIEMWRSPSSIYEKMAKAREYIIGKTKRTF